MASRAATPATTPIRRALGVLGNERLTATAGLVVLLLSAAELVTVVALGTLLPEHIVIGMLLAGPIVVKLGSTGWRFLRYYTRAAPYVRKGPPLPILRLLAPLLAISTITLIASGILLALVGPGSGLLLDAHVLSFLIWTVCLVVHAVAYAPAALGWFRREVAARRGAPQVPGRAGRLATNVIGVVAGIVGAVVVLPASSAWNGWGGESGTKFVILAAVGSAVALVLVRWINRTTWGRGNQRP
ncbi:hypothetical protein [Curtobacterium ammoniigenes]|uniref:hypothetical protein n=1 Tax=Curtobacterium ammoniigenes TaxID=395387 RepID=UPI00082B6020|nr:hypothetical protein [Curtobacterium ammoniigenes]